MYFSIYLCPTWRSPTSETQAGNVESLRGKRSNSSQSSHSPTYGQSHGSLTQPLQIMFLFFQKLVVRHLRPLDHGYGDWSAGL